MIKKNCLKTDETSFWQKLFSVKDSYVNDKWYKVICLLGLKISINVTKIYYLKLQKKYVQLENNLKKKTKINIVFMVSMVSMFPARPFLDYLLLKQNERFNVKVLIIPDLRFGLDNAKKLQEECFCELSKEYCDDIIIKSPINEQEDSIDLSQIADILFCSLPYDVSHKKYDLDSLIKLGILPALVNYGYFRSKYDIGLVSSYKYSKYWKIFVENEQNMIMYQQFQRIKGKNCVLSGYVKMDKYKHYDTQIKEKDRKVVMIAPHHSVPGGYNTVLGLSNFYKYADLFLKLPDLYPQLNFIFRPHPALFLCLERDGFWGKEKVDTYISSMRSKKNVRYSEGGNYLLDFAESDALIEDCGSFLVDYFYTKKPHCYMLKNKEEIEDTFSSFGKACINNVYQAYDQSQILDFIDNVVINNQDYMKNQREKFAESEVMINYPCASNIVYKYLKDILGERK